MIHTAIIAPVHELLARQANKNPEKIAFVDKYGSVSYQELYEHTANLAANFSGLGLQVGDAVAVYLPNSVSWVTTVLACLRAGLVAVPISHDASPSEVLYRIQDAECKLAVTSKAGDDVLSTLAVSLACGVVVNDDGAGDKPRLSELRRQRQGEPFDGDDIDSVAFLVYTSGTTGKPKGVALTVASMLWVSAACWAPIAGLNEDDYVLSFLPLYHSYALNFSLMTIIAVGATEYIGEKYSTSEVLRQLRSGKVTVFPGVPTMFHYLLEAMRSSPVETFPGLRLCLSAGAIMPAATNSEFEKRFGVPLLDGYGITETSTMVTLNWPTGARVMGSCGLPVPGVQVRIVDTATDKDVALGEEGELIVRGPNLMQGYHRLPEANAEALRDGWYRTGDLAKQDRNGYLFITGRLKELIIRGGQNIAPAEVEDAILTVDGVADCAVVGMPDSKLGEVPVAFVVEREGQVLTQESIIAHCTQALSSYKVPRDVHIVHEIPRTGSGKILRFRLKEDVSSK